jgi:hypothetical protein
MDFIPMTALVAVDYWRGCMAFGVESICKREQNVASQRSTCGCRSGTSPIFIGLPSSSVTMDEAT